MAIKTNSQPAPQRQTVLTFATPSVADILFYETVDGQRIGTAVPEYGTPHPDSRRWPNHKLVFIQNDDDTGQLLRYYYAADRESQDDYNYELNDGVAVTRTYVLPRDKYPADLPVPEGGYPDTLFPDYGFVGDTIADVGDVLRGHYIVVQRKFEPITRTESLYDSVLEVNKLTTTTIKPFGYQLSDDNLESGGGTVYEVKFANQFHSLLIESEAGVGYPLQRQSVLTFVTPLVADILFYETVPSLGADIPEYGQPHPDPTNWPNHKLVYVDTEDSGKGHLQRWYYAADRDSQDEYNYELAEGQSLTRTYVIPREDYPTVFTYPAGGTPDEVYSEYGFVGDNLVDIGTPLNGLYVAIQRKYEPITRTDIQYDSVLEQNGTVITRIKPFNYQLSDDGLVSDNGVIYEVKYVNQFHSLLIESEEGIAHPLQRKPIINFVSPNIGDTLFYEVVPVNGDEVPEYGTAHPDAATWPNHKLVYVEPEGGSNGHLQKFFYAANRIEQEEHNWTISYPYAGITTAPRFSCIFVLPEATYSPAAIGSAHPITTGIFSGAKLVSERQVDTGLKEIDSVYIAVERIYDKVPTISQQEGYNAKISYPYSGNTNFPRTERTYIIPRADLATAVIPSASLDLQGATLADRRVDRFENQPEESLYVLVTVVHDKIPLLSDLTPGGGSDFLKGFGYTVTRPYGSVTYPRVTWKIPAIKAGYTSTANYTLCPITGYTTLKLIDESVQVSEDNVNTLTLVRVYEKFPGPDLDTEVREKFADVPEGFIVERKIEEIRTPVDAATAIGGLDSTGPNNPSGAIIKTELSPMGGDNTVVLSKGSTRLTVTFGNLVSYDYDEETGLVYPVTEEIVPEGTVGAGLDSSGFYSTVRALNQYFAVKTTRKATTLQSREYQNVVNWSWPSVLKYLNFFAVEDKAGELVRFGYDYELKESYSGPCKATVQESWSRSPVAVPSVTAMMPASMSFDFPLTRDFSIPRCLHGPLSITEVIGTNHPDLAYTVTTKNWPATNYTDWPSQILGSVDQTPYRGGYKMTRVYVFKPA